MRRSAFLVLVISLSTASMVMALPGFDISVGPYVGAYKPSLKTVNEQVLLYDHQTAYGYSAIYGIQAKVGLPMGLGGGIEFGSWSNKKEWTDDQADIHAYKVKLMPVDVFAQYSMPLVPMVLKGKAGASVGKVWADFDVSQTRPDQWNHYWNSEGSAASFGIFTGLDLVALPKVNIGFDVGYKFCEVEKLTIVECHEEGSINDVLEYYNHDLDQVIPLPLELSGVSSRLVVSYVF